MGLTLANSRDALVRRDVRLWLLCQQFHGEITADSTTWFSMAMKAWSLKSIFAPHQTLIRNWYQFQGKGSSRDASVRLSFTSVLSYYISVEHLVHKLPL
jgi:hypothetical protein